MALVRVLDVVVMPVVSMLRRYVANLPLTRKFVLLCTLLTVGVILLAVAAARLQYLDLVEARKLSVKTEVEMGLTVMQHYADKVKAGELSLEQAKEAARTTLADMRTNDGVDYFFIVDPQMRILMHPKRPVGSDMTDYKSDAGQYVYRDIKTAIDSGDGFSYYDAPKPGKKEQLPKISYAEKFPAWNWVLVMGVYAEDIQVQAWGFTRTLTLIGGAPGGTGDRAVLVDRLGHGGTATRRLAHCRGNRFGPLRQRHPRGIAR